MTEGVPPSVAPYTRFKIRLRRRRFSLKARISQSRAETDGHFLSPPDYRQLFAIFIYFINVLTILGEISTERATKSAFISLALA